MRHHPISTILSSGGFLVGHLREFIKGKKSLTVCLIGPDGAGKSTTALGLCDAMSDVFSDRHYYHAHYGLLPELKTFLPRSLRQSQPSPVPGAATGSKTPGKLTTFVLMTYYAMDYILGHIKSLPTRGLGDLKVFDRYYYDFFIQPSAFRANNLLSRFFLRVVPSPDLLFYLDAPAGLIRERKPELALAEIERQAGICRQIISDRGGYIVDSSLPLADVVNQIRGVSLAKMVRRLGPGR